MRTLLFLLFTIFTAQAFSACMPPSVAEGAVSGRTYILNGTEDSNYPTILKFGNSKTVFYGTKLDGAPDGEFKYRGTCHGEIIVTFHSFFQDEVEIVLHMKPKTHEYFKIQDIHNNELGFTIKID